ncbi:hypothetical protein [Geodermatophilus sp. CPCC 205761]|uniref:hypothetical protein n=1 Tax=Geodermatophilus sp. CPCC 205761 TaxID=2936597 RepID=UPI003EE9D143
MTTVDGQRVEGRPGIAWYSEPRGFALLLTTDEGSAVRIARSEVQSVMPVMAPDPLRVVESVARFLRQPSAIPNGRVWMSAIVDEHHYVSVAVALLRKPCLTLQP